MQWWQGTISVQKEPPVLDNNYHFVREDGFGSKWGKVEVCHIISWFWTPAWKNKNLSEIVIIALIKIFIVSWWAMSEIKKKSRKGHVHLPINHSSINVGLWINPILLGGGDNFVVHQKCIPITSIWVKLHKNVIKYVLEIYFPNCF